MKSIALTLLLATAVAEEGVTCSDLSNSWSQSAPHNPDLDDPDANGCLAKCSAAISELGDTIDACCMAVINVDGFLQACQLY